ncbi:MAG: transcriptional regulator [Candidatus Heimdallarchaeota archaeon]
MSMDDPVAEISSLNEVIHVPARLGIMLLLFGHQRLTFSQVQKALNLSAGNLSSHARRLEQAGYLIISKGFVELKPRTLLKITEEGTFALKNYATALTSVLNNCFLVDK